jgi:fructose 1,6-bisphosphate aldolase/phosphatase
MRQHGPFEPHRLGLNDMEYTTLPQVLDKLVGKGRGKAKTKGRKR